jgi:hypothetical protein
MRMTCDLELLGVEFALQWAGSDRVRTMSDLEVLGMGSAPQWVECVTIARPEEGGLVVIRSPVFQELPAK